MGFIDKLFGKKDAAVSERHKDDGGKDAPHSVPPPPAGDPLPLLEVAPAAAPLLASAMPSPVETPVEPPAPPAPDPAPEGKLETGAGPFLVKNPTPESGPESLPDQPAQPTIEQMRSDPNFVRVYDQYGQEVFLTRQQWREEILPASFFFNF